MTNGGHARRPAVPDLEQIKNLVLMDVRGRAVGLHERKQVGVEIREDAIAVDRDEWLHRTHA